MNDTTLQDGIVLLAKKPGLTSFSSLHSVKKALGTTKVGHTGTLDSFAQGLLVVCTGRLTRLAGQITAFDKSYSAVIKFGEETDTLEYTGQVIRTAPLPSRQSFEKAVAAFTGRIMQTPPAFSAIHIDGKRASDLTRSGKEAVIPPRPVTVYGAEIKAVETDSEGKVLYALIDFSVSKGTYIRSLARDIGNSCGSAAHLIGLYRIKVGNFRVEDAAGYNLVKDFSINSAIQMMNKELEKSGVDGQPGEITKSRKTFVLTPEEIELQNQIRSTKQDFNKETSLLCGFENITLKDADAEKDFCNGKPLRSALFGIDLHTIKPDTLLAVFSQEGCFRGLIEKESGGRIRHRFVIN